MAKHYDNKNQLLEELKRRKLMADNAIAATFTSYMMLSCMVLFEEFNYDQDDIVKFRDEIYKRLDLYHDGKLTVSDIESTLLNDLGVYIEKPNF